MTHAEMPPRVEIVFHPKGNSVNVEGEAAFGRMDCPTVIYVPEETLRREIDGWKQLHENNEACINKQKAEISQLREDMKNMWAGSLETNTHLYTQITALRENLAHNITADHKFAEEQRQIAVRAGYKVDALEEKLKESQARESRAREEGERRVFEEAWTVYNHDKEKFGAWLYRMAILESAAASRSGEGEK